MIVQNQVANKVKTLPDPLARLVDLFIDFLLQRYQEDLIDDELDSDLLTHIAASGGAFDWLNDPAEDDIYSDADGEPVTN